MHLLHFNPVHIKKPIFAKQILFYMDELKDDFPEEYERLLAYFDPDIIRELLNGEDEEAIYQLFQSLPLESFRAFVDLISSKILVWNLITLSAAVKVLVQLDLIKFLTFCEATEYSANYPTFGILKALMFIAPAYGEKQFEFLANAIISSNNSDRAINFSSLIAILGCLYSIERHSQMIIESISHLKDDETEVDNFFSELYNQFSNDSPYLQLIYDLKQERNRSLLTDFSLLFKTDAPLAGIETAFRLYDAAYLQRIQELISAYPGSVKNEHNHLQTFSDFSNNFHDPGLQNYWADFLSALLLTDLQITENDLAHFSMDEIYDLLSLDILNLPFLEIITARLRELPDEEIAARLIQMARQYPGPNALISMIQIMGKLQFPEFIDILIDLSVHERGEQVSDQASSALFAFGVKASPRIAERWNNLNSVQKIYCNNNLKYFGSELTQQILLDWAKAEKNLDEHWFDMAMYYPSPEILKIIKHELRREQSFIEAAFYISCCLLDIPDPNMIEFEKREKTRREYKQISLNQLVGNRLDSSYSTLASQLYLKLRCRKCAGVNTYQIDKICISNDENYSPADFFIPDQPRCLSCGDETDFELHPDAYYAIFSNAFKMRLFSERDIYYERRVILTGPIYIGNKMIPLQDALRRYEELYQNNLYDVKTILGFAEVSARFGKSEQAMNLCLTAQKLDPVCAEAVYILAQLYLESELIDEALYILEKSWVHEEEWNYYKVVDISEKSFKLNYIELLNALLKISGFPPIETIFADSLSHQRNQNAKSHKMKKRR
jgi:hypothetical protein